MEEITPTHNVLDCHKKDNATKVTLDETATGKTLTLNLSRFVYINPEHDRLRIKNEVGVIRSILKVVSDGHGGETFCQVYPYYQRCEEMAIHPSLKIQLEYREMVDKKDLEFVRFLDQFHYLGGKTLWGREQTLVVIPRGELADQFPPCLGFLTLNSASLISGCRDDLLGWTQEEKDANIDRIVRIARIVIHPEFRGIGIGKRLVHHAIEYAKRHWNAVGKKPWMLETVAEMSRYHPFFERAGMLYVGLTKGTEDVSFTPKSDLISKQGRGYKKASTDRFKMTKHPPKPYYVFPLDEEIAQRIQKVPHVQTFSDPLMSISPPPLVQLIDLKVEYFRPAPWTEHEKLSLLCSDTIEKGIGVFDEIKSWSNRMSNGVKEDSDWKVIASVLDDLKNAGAENLARYIEKVQNRVESVIDACEELAEQTNRPIVTLRDIEVAQAPCLGGLAEEMVGELRLFAQRLEEILLRGEVMPGIQKKKLNDALYAVRRFAEKTAAGGFSSREREIERAFGVVPSAKCQVINGYSIDIRPGEIVLLLGPSGSGKSTFLNAILGHLANFTTGRVLPEGVTEQMGVLQSNGRSYRSLIDDIGDSVSQAIYILNMVGLSEAHVYLKREHELSHGQRYRAAVARLIYSGKSIWIADEFCAFLDPLTTAIVSTNIRKMAQSLGVTFIAAASCPDYLIETLKPTRIIRINSGGRITPSPRAIHMGKRQTANNLIEGLAEVRDGKPVKDEYLTRYLSALELLGPGNGLTSSFEITDYGKQVLKSKDPRGALIATLDEKDLLFHRLYSVFIRERDSHNLPAEELMASLPDEFPWKRKTLRNEINLRKLLFLSAVEGNLQNGSIGPIRKFRDYSMKSS